MAQHHASAVPSVPPQALQRFQPQAAPDGEISQLATAGGNASGPAQFLQQQALNRPQDSQARLAVDLPLSRVAADRALAAVRVGHRLWKEEAAPSGGCSMAVQGCFRLSAAAATQRSIPRKRPAEDALHRHLFYTGTRFLSQDPRHCTGRVSEASTVLS